MKKNLGFVDRIIRFVIFDFLLGLSFIGNETIQEYGTLAFIIGLLLLFNVITGFSLIYKLFGISTVEPSSSE